MRNEIEQTLQSERVTWMISNEDQKTNIWKKNQLNYWNRNVLTSPEGDIFYETSLTSQAL